MRTLLATLLVLCSTSALAQVQVTIDVYPPTCDGCCNGAAEASIEGCVVGSLVYQWIGPTTFVSPTEDIEGVCEEGVYVFYVMDDIGTSAEVTFEMEIGANPFTIIENFPIDCINGGITIYCDLFSFPPSDSLSNGEACVVPPECWTTPVSYLWFDEDQNAIGTSDCIVGLAPGNYFVIVENSNEEQVTFDVPMMTGSDIGMISQEVCPPNGIEESESLRFDLFPNPAYDHLLLSIDVPLLGLRYRIVDLQGREVMQGQVNSFSTTIDLSFLRAGTYVITVLGGVGEVMGVERLVRE